MKSSGLKLKVSFTRLTAPGGLDEEARHEDWAEMKIAVRGVKLLLTLCFISYSRKVAGHLYNASEHNRQKIDAALIGVGFHTGKREVNVKNMACVA